MSDTPRPNRWKKSAAAGALVLTGVGVGAVVAGGGFASAAPNTAPPAAYSSTGAPSGSVDESKSVRPDEQLLTGDTATKVRDAALAKYPGATVQRVETDSEGVYEAHLVTADGTPTIVQVGADFTVTGAQQGGPAGSPGGDRGPGPGAGSGGAGGPGGGSGTPGGSGAPGEDGRSGSSSS